MARLDLFDIDMSLEVDPSTRDLKTTYNEEAVNQSIDLFLTNPYRIGVGLTNRIFSMVFSDMKVEQIADLKDTIETEFRRSYYLIAFKKFNLIPDSGNRRMLASIDWYIPKSTLSGQYVRYWHQPS